ncbi:MAG: DUF4375 domain-containing protein [Parabacteroides sp.]|nr:DUF4375 domain-containing protein [Parabacteroides sp.]
MNWIRKILGLEHPERITMELIERLPAHKLCRKYIDIELDADIETEEFDNIMCAVELDAEVINGGFNQYFYNTAGERAERAENTFVKLGAMQVADVVKRANKQYVANRDKLHSIWNGTMEGFSYGYKEKLFDTFDEEYYALMKNNKQLYTLIGTYIKQHPKDFLTE